MSLFGRSLSNFSSSLPSAMLLKPAKAALHRLCAAIEGASIDADGRDGASMRVLLEESASDAAALIYAVRRGRGNASVFAGAHVSLWAAESFAEPGFEVEPAFLAELPAERRPEIVALRRRSVHEYAFLGLDGVLSSDYSEFRPSVQVIGWTMDELHNDIRLVIDECRRLWRSLPSPSERAELIARRVAARQPVRHRAQQ